ncbi:MAG: hypothetical protein IJ250_03100 [Bacteroidales bacterium]|nr:hypothetical protein [Bacteroidales bacterium]
MKNLKILSVSILIFSSMILQSCSDDKNDSSLNVNEKKNVITEFEPQDGEFMTFIQYTSDSLDLLHGNSLQDFIRKKTFNRSILTNIEKIVYSFSEDLDNIIVSSRNTDSNTFNLNIWDEDFTVFDISDNASGTSISFKVLNNNYDDTLICTVKYADISARDFISTLSLYDTIPNPFTVSDTTTANFSPSIGVLISLGSLAVSIANFFKDIFDTNCSRSLDVDKHNCSQGPNKCVEQDGRCHYKCIPCMTNEEDENN